MDDSTAVEDILWRARPADDLVWSQLGDAFVAYHRPSGRTHFLNVPTAELLAHVLGEPRTARSAAEQLAAREGADSDATFVAAVAQSLLQLEHLGLVDRCER
jgi:PqqD family protein of HPr-rel-A system